MPRTDNKGVTAYPLFNSGSFTWNKKHREIVFMRAGNPQHKLKDMREGSYFRVQGNDIKLLYQVLHEHFARLTPAQGGMVRTWREHAPPGPTARHGPNGVEVDPHIKYKDGK